MKNPHIKSKPTDKGGGLVWMGKSCYQDSLVIKGYLGSNVCQEVPLDSDRKVLQNLKSLVEKYKWINIM